MYNHQSTETYFFRRKRKLLNISLRKCTICKYTKGANKKKKKEFDQKFPYNQFPSGEDLQLQSSSVERNRFSRRPFTKDVRKGRRNGRKVRQKFTRHRWWWERTNGGRVERAREKERKKKKKKKRGTRFGLTNRMAKNERFYRNR